MRFAVKTLLLVVVLFLPLRCLYAQPVLNDLCEQCTKAAGDSAKIEALGKLAAYYYAIREDALADSLVDKQIVLAEENRSRPMMLNVLFQNPGFTLLGSVTRTHKNIVTLDASATTLSYINKALEYAKGIRNDEYTALAYRLLSVFYMGQGQFSESARYANICYTTALNTKNDSVKAVCGLQLGFIYMQKKDILMAFKTYTAAFDIANERQHYGLLSQVYHYFADMYRKLDRQEECKDYILRSVELNKKHHNPQRLIDDYLFLGKIHEYNIAISYLQKAEQLADSMKDMFGKIEAEKIVFAYGMLQGDYTIPINYLKTHPDLRNIFIRVGRDYHDWMMSDVFLYSGKADSAYLYFIKAEPGILSSYTTEVKQIFSGEFAACYKLMDSTQQSIDHYRKAIDFSHTTSNVSNLIDYIYNLQALYYKLGNYKTAYDYSVLHNQYKDSLSKLANEKELALREIDNIEKQRAKDEELAKIANERRHNLQYMAITVSIVLVFIILVFLGMFRVSRLTIRILGFFSFIFFFEFIILLADHKIHHWMHGEPLYIWLVKIALLSILLPLHHMLEEKVIHYLVSKDMLVWKEKLSLKKLFERLRSKSVQKTEGGDNTPPS